MPVLNVGTTQLDSGRSKHHAMGSRRSLDCHAVTAHQSWPDWSPSLYWSMRSRKSEPAPTPSSLRSPRSPLLVRCIRRSKTRDFDRKFQGSDSSRRLTGRGGGTGRTPLVLAFSGALELFVAAMNTVYHSWSYVFTQRALGVSRASTTKPAQFG